jgi:hypothetical protein
VCVHQVSGRPVQAYLSDLPDSEWSYIFTGYSWLSLLNDISKEQVEKLEDSLPTSSLLSSYFFVVILVIATKMPTIQSKISRQCTMPVTAKLDACIAEDNTSLCTS